ncbi:MAG: gamma carbonic anhydrase family protein, partial [Cellvibrionales bacterium]|nr:gamma carbonic anhydrase family protein [Cellvibrionales bacterium]
MTIRSFNEYTPVLAKGVFIDPSAVVIGNVRLGQDCSVWPQAVIR